MNLKDKLPNLSASSHYIVYLQQYTILTIIYSQK